MSEHQFLQAMHALFKQINFFAIGEQDCFLINKFILVSSENNLIDVALNAMQSDQYFQTPFMVYQRGEKENETIGREFKTIGLLKRSIEEDLVVPYFQGIYNNRTRQIDRYEALMRIVDHDGTVYGPGQFLDTAKKYHFYTGLSCSMIGKALDLFKNRKEMIQVNISAYDVNSAEAQRFIFDKLSEFEDCSHVVFEIVEDEYFNNLDTLNEFITRVRNYGVKIALDDFGSGYSNFQELMAIKPDYIKIDGSIISTVNDEEINSMVMDTILFLAKRINVDLIAEYVETAAIQARVEACGITCSQGFYFSFPGPFDAVVGKKDELRTQGRE